MTANRAASIRARLKQHADARKQDFNLVLTRYGLERLLYRLSISEHAPNFLLKGALLFQFWYSDEHRPTRDADLLGFGPGDVSALMAVTRRFTSRRLRLRQAPTCRKTSKAEFDAFVECSLLHLPSVTPALLGVALETLEHDTQNGRAVN